MLTRPSPQLQKISAFLLALLGVFLILGTSSLPFQILGLLLLLTTGFLHPTYSLFLLIFSVPFGELGRLSLSGFSFLLTDLTALLALPPLLFFSYQSRPLHFTRTHWWLLIFLALASVSWLVHFPFLPTSTSTSALLYLVRLLAYASIFILTPFALPKKSHQNSILTATLLGIALTALLGFIQLRYFSDFIKLGLDQLGYDPHQGRLTSTWLDPNFVGGLFAFGLTITIALLLTRHKHRSLLFILALILLAALFYTYSRSAYLSFATAIFILALFRARWIIPIGFIALLLILGSGTRASQRIWDMLDSFTALSGSQTTVLDPTSRLRVENWQEAFQIIEQNPLLGTGYGSYAYAQWHEGNLKSPSAHHSSGADSSLLTVWATTGTLGLFAFLSFIISLTLTLLKKIKEPLTLGLFAGLSGIFIHSFFVNSLFFSLLLAILIPLTSRFTK